MTREEFRLQAALAASYGAATEIRSDQDCNSLVYRAKNYAEKLTDYIFGYEGSDSWQQNI